MRISAHCEIIGQNIPHRVGFPILKKLGAEGVEVVMRSGAELNLDSKDVDFLRIADLAKDSGLAISGMTAGYTWSLPMSSNNSRIRNKGITALIRQIEGAKLLGTDSLLIVPGYARTEYITPSELVEPELALARATEGIITVLPYAEKENIHLYVENVWNGLLQTPEEMSGFIDCFDSEWIGAYFDVGNVFPDGNPIHWINILGNRIGRVHMKDYDRNQKGLAGYGQIGKGCVDFSKIIVSLKNIGYDGWIGAEIHNNRCVKEAEITLTFLWALKNL